MYVIVNVPDSCVFLSPVDDLKWEGTVLSLAIYFTVVTLAAEQELDSGSGSGAGDPGPGLRPRLAVEVYFSPGVRGS